LDKEATMRRVVVAVGVLMTLGLGTVMTAPGAQADFERGANCHIEQVTSNGRVTFRISNRLYDPARIECLVRFSTGTEGYYRTYVPARTQVIRRWTYGGPWEWLRITHVHIIRIY
jgi:hypothetical protein